MGRPARSDIVDFAGCWAPGPGDKRGHSGRFPADGIAEMELRGKNRRTTATCRITELVVGHEIERGGS